MEKYQKIMENIIQNKYKFYNITNKIEYNIAKKYFNDLLKINKKFAYKIDEEIDKIIKDIYIDKTINKISNELLFIKYGIHLSFFDKLKKENGFYPNKFYRVTEVAKILALKKRKTINHSEIAKQTQSISKIKYIKLNDLQRIIEKEYSFYQNEIIINFFKKNNIKFKEDITKIGISYNIWTKINKHYGKNYFKLNTKKNQEQFVKLLDCIYFLPSNDNFISYSDNKKNIRIKKILKLYAYGELKIGKFTLYVFPRNKRKDFEIIIKKVFEIENQMKGYK